MSKTCQTRLSTYGSLTRANKENNLQLQFAAVCTAILALL